MMPTCAPLIEVDPAERLSADYQASQREAEFLAAALRVHAVRAATAARGLPGICSNCGEACAPRAVYCDAMCRADHEARERAAPRLRGS